MFFSTNNVTVYKIDKTKQIVKLCNVFSAISKRSRVFSYN